MRETDAAGREHATPLELTLAQQMKINQIEIEKRLRLLDIGEADRQALRAQREVIADDVEAIVDAFYVFQQAEPETALLIGDQETFRRLHASMRRYVLDLFDAWLDAAYVDRRLRIGIVHKRIGVSPKLYVSAVHQLERLLEQRVTAGVADGEARSRCLQALRKVLMFDIQLVFDTYIRSLVAEVEQARDALAHHADDLERLVAERTTQLETMSRSDLLTGVGNQRFFYEEMRREMARAERHGEPFVLVYIDLNGFKALNDHLGHRAGDALLARVGEALRLSVRDSDRCFRYGGDEFCVLLPNTTADAAEALVERLFLVFSGAVWSGVGLSAGIAQAGPEAFPTIDQLVQAADAAMYAAKARSHAEGGHARATAP